jgi:hypothetical protein
MPILNCTVSTCHHNVDERCSLDKIQVSGESADTMGETACASFKARKENRCMNAMGMPDAHSAVSCAATHCVHNTNCQCNAENIGICGHEACECRDTECTTFSGK